MLILMLTTQLSFSLMLFFWHHNLKKKKTPQADQGVLALSSPTCTSPMYAQRWNTQAPSGMVPFVTQMRYNSKESKQQSLAESCMPHETLRKDNFLKNSTGLLFDGVEK